MTPVEAAAVIGCHPRHVRTLVQRGRLQARRQPTKANRHGYILVLHAEGVRRYAATEQSQGWPRGVKRS